MSYKSDNKIKGHDATQRTKVKFICNKTLIAAIELKLLKFTEYVWF